MASQGRSARRKGGNFERKIAQDMRLIFDGADWTSRHALLTPKQQVAHLKTSRVRRGEQGKGAREPDIVISERSWWFELQHASGTFNPEGKLAQAEKDIAERAEPNRWHPISICHKTGEHTIWCAMRIPTLILLATGKFAQVSDAAIVRIPYDALLRMLESDEAKS